MGKMIIVEGEPGTGKSRAILNMNPENTLLIVPNRKDLPFRSGAKKFSTESGNKVLVNSLNQVRELIAKANGGKKFKTIVVDDFTHLMSKKVVKDIKSKGFDKWNELAFDVFFSILEDEVNLREDLDVILIGHVQYTQDTDGTTKTFLQTPGKLLDNLIKLPSYVTYILHTDVSVNEKGEIIYSFLTNHDGTGREAKSPEGCLDLFEPNDYALILNKIEKYQKSDE